MKNRLIILTFISISFTMYNMTFNGESGYDTTTYHIHIGLFDLEKIIKK